MIHQPKGNTDGFLTMLKTLLRHYKKILIELWVDHAHWHKGARLAEFLQIHQRLKIEYLPKYHPEFNFQERLWKTMRYEETTNTYYETFEAMNRAVFRRSQKWKPEKLMSLCHTI